MADQIALNNALNAKRNDIINAGMRMMSKGNAYYYRDMLAQGVIQHTLANINAFILLTQAENYLCAFSTIRMQMDALLRFFSTWLVEDSDALAQRIIFSDDFHKIVVTDKHDRKHKLTASFLCEQFEIQEGVDWAKRVYKETSRFIHPTGVHFFSTLRDMKDETREMTIVIHPDGKSKCSPVDLAQGTMCIIAITDLIIKYIDKWTAIKNGKEKAHD